MKRDARGFVIPKKSAQNQQDEEESDLVNEDILKRTDKALVIDEKGKSLGEMAVKEAIHKAKRGGFELALVSKDGSSKHICKIRSVVGRVEVLKKKKEEQEERLRPRMKEVRISDKITENDLTVKISKVREQLLDRNRLKITLEFKKMYEFDPVFGKQMIEYIVERLSDIAKVEQQLETFNRSCFVVMVPKSLKVLRSMGFLDENNKPINKDQGYSLGEEDNGELELAESELDTNKKQQKISQSPMDSSSSSKATEYQRRKALADRGLDIEKSTKAGVSLSEVLLYLATSSTDSIDDVKKGAAIRARASRLESQLSKITEETDLMPVASEGDDEQIFDVDEQDGLSLEERQMLKHYARELEKRTNSEESVLKRVSDSVWRGDLEVDENYVDENPLFEGDDDDGYEGRNRHEDDEFDNDEMDAEYDQDVDDSPTTQEPHPIKSNTPSISEAQLAAIKKMQANQQLMSERSSRQQEQQYNFDEYNFDSLSKLGREFDEEDYKAVERNRLEKELPVEGVTYYSAPTQTTSQYSSIILDEKEERRWFPHFTPPSLQVGARTMFEVESKLGTATQSSKLSTLHKMDRIKYKPPASKSIDEEDEEGYHEDEQPAEHMDEFDRIGTSKHRSSIPKRR